jgi:riboflavin kinase/FMN adenylyltransferase
MKHVDSIDALSLDACELTIGSFDGIHVGHRQLVREMRRSAEQAGLPTTVLSFFPHPSVVLRGRKPAFYLSSPAEKAEMLGDLSVDYVINQPFDVELSRLRAATFLDWIEEQLHPKALWVGPDFALGHRREGNQAYLRAAAAERGFQLHVVEPSMVDGEVVSSTRIRQALRAGDITLANRLLGAPFGLPCRFDGFEPAPQDSSVRTFRLEISEERACPREGVYGGRLVGGSDQEDVLVHVVLAPDSDDDPKPSQIDVYLSPGSEPSAAWSRLTFGERLGDSARSPLPKSALHQLMAAVRGPSPDSD